MDCWSSYFKLKDETCRVRFVYGFGEEKGERRVRVESEPQCFKVDFLVIGLSLMGAIVAIGVALLLTWRILTFLYDKKEYARFINDTQNAKWANVSESNQPVSIVQHCTSQCNPVGSSVDRVP